MCKSFLVEQIYFFFLALDICQYFCQASRFPGATLSNTLPLLLASPRDEKHNMRKSVIACLVIFAGSRTLHQLSGTTHLPRSFCNRRCKLAFFSRTWTPLWGEAFHYLYDQSRRSLSFESGVTRAIVCEEDRPRRALITHVK